MKKAKPLPTGGVVKPGFEDVLQTFLSNIKNDIEKGGSFAVYYHGQLVANLWGGYCDYDCRRPWKEDTLSTFFSSTKAVASSVIAHLVDRGLLSYQEKVSKVWPEFAQNGKANVTLEQLITNQAGLITLEEPYWLSELRDDPVGLGKKLARQRPYWTPGEKFGYHPLTFGLYLDQIVRHVDKKGRSLAQYFQEEMAEPFGIEFYIGLPKPLTHRATRNILNKQYTRADYDAERNKKFDGDMELYLATTNNPQDFRSGARIGTRPRMSSKLEQIGLKLWLLWQQITPIDFAWRKWHIELYIGLPKHLFHRATRVRLTRRPDTEELLKRFRGELDLILETSKNPQDFKTVINYFCCSWDKAATRVRLTRRPDTEELLKRFIGELDLLIETSKNPQDFKTTLKINDPDNRELPCPSTHGHGTAANMARFFGILANGGALEGKRLMSEKAVQQMTVPRVEGYDCSFGIDSRWGLGVQLFTVLEGTKEYHILGHGGYGGQYAGADLEHNVAFAYTTSFLDPFSSYDSTGDQRMKSMFDSLYRCVERIEHISVPRETYAFYSEYIKAVKDKNRGRSKL